MRGPVAALAITTLSLAACGRLGFEPATGGDALAGHDEDADGIADAVDPCPHLPGPHTDGDGDGVGDDCDPYPQRPSERIAAFISFEDGHPFELTTDRATWTPGRGDLHFAGDHGELHLPVDFGGLRVALGADLIAVGAPVVQNQLAVHVEDPNQATRFFGEINELPGLSVASITRYDGDYLRLAEAPLASGVRPGSVFHQVTYRVDDATPVLELETGWIGEPYTLSAPITAYGRGRLWVRLNNLELRFRYIVLIETTP